MRRCSVKLMTNPWASHVAPGTVTSMYKQLAAKGVIESHPTQAGLAQLCDPLTDLAAEKQAVMENHGRAIQAAEAAKNSHEQPRIKILSREERRKQRQEYLRSVQARLKEFSDTWRSKMGYHGGIRAEFSNRTNTTEKGLAAQRQPEVIGSNISGGLYLYGDVGIGKTMMMDLFELAPAPLPKRRAHLHSFMTELHERVHKLTLEQRGLPESQKVTPIDKIALEMVEEAPILCFDEFQTFDVAHASLLSAFFSRAFKHGILLVTTSNKPPEALLSVGQAFDDFVPLIREHCTVVHVDGISDFRRKSMQPAHKHVFLTPNNVETDRQLLKFVNSGFTDQGKPWTEDLSLTHVGRSVVIPRSKGGVGVFYFAQICGSAQQLGPVDFQLLAKHFHTIVMLQVPQIGVMNKNIAKQFIVLVDELYQHRVNLLFTCTVPWEHILEERDYHTGQLHFDDHTQYYTDAFDERREFQAEFQSFMAKEEVVSFKRIASRLAEMGSLEYLTSSHVDFVSEDFDVSIYEQAVRPYVTGGAETVV